MNSFWKWIPGLGGVSVEREDSLLVERAVGGDGDAFAQLVDRHAPALSIFIGLSNFQLNNEDVQDILQQTLIKACRNLRSFRSKGSFKAWLFRIARHEVTSGWRHDTAAKRPPRSLASSLNTTDPVTGLPFEVRSEVLSPADACAKREELLYLKSAFADLDAESQELLALKFGFNDSGCENLSDREIGDILGLSQKAIEHRRRRALDELRQSIICQSGGDKIKISTSLRRAQKDESQRSH